MMHNSVGLMAASTDLLQQQPQQQHHHQQGQQQALHNTHSIPSTNPWGTWEELLLASAVQKHGADNWILVSAELQSRARASFSFTPEACRAEYQAIKLRFGSDEGREGNDMPWFEELRRLRVAHLRRELEQYDNSIGSLENKIKRLQSEKEQSTRNKSLVSGEESAKAPIGSSEEPSGNVVADEPAISGLPNAGSAMVQPNPSPTIAQPNPRPTTAQQNGNETPGPTTVQPNGGEAPSSTMMQPNGGEEAASDQQALGEGRPHKKQGEHLEILESTVRVDETKSVEGSSPKDVVFDQEVAVQDNGLREQPVVAEEMKIAVVSVKAEQDVGGDESNTAEILTRNCDAGVSRQLCESSDTASARQTKQANCTATDMMVDSDLGGESGLSDWPGNPMLAVQNDDTVRPVVSQSLEALDIKECEKVKKGKAMLPKAAEDDGDIKSDDSESLCSPRLKSSSLKRRRCVDGSLGSGGETCLQDDDDKRLVCRSLGEKVVLKSKQSLPVESADSTEGKHQKVVASKNPCQEPSTSKVKIEMLTSEDAVPEIAALEIKGGHQSLASREPAAAFLGPSVLDMKNRSTSSTENSLLHEVWGESAEVVDKEMEPARKKGRFTGHGRKRKSCKSIAKDFEEERDATNLSTQVESSVKTGSMTTSNEASESMHAPGGKEGNDDDTEAWHQMERFSGDSRFEKSEVGSFVDGNEDLSPMSRRNRREPKVAGKLIPLLESLRTVCAHKCASLFKHNQESQHNRRYHLLIRAPVDLGMIRAKLEEGQYSGSLHFFRDLLLMVSNALVYYPKDSPESVAASGLRECILKEMGFVFETEALLKQEGPSFRSRDSGKAGRLTAKQGRRKGLNMLSAMDTTTRDLALKQSDVSTSVDSRQNIAFRLDEGARAEKTISDIKVGSSSNAKRVPDKETMSRGSGGSKLVSVAMVEKSNEPRELGPNKATATIPKDSKVKERLAESTANRKGGSAKAVIISKTPAIASDKGVERSGCKTKAAPDTTQEPVKRGVGRPPKHSQHQGSQKAREEEMPNPPRKRVRR